MEKGFWGCGDCGLRLNPIGIWISGVVGNRLVPARDFFLEKKQKRARCSGLPSQFILCRTCRAKAACLVGVSVCIPHAAARHALRAPCGRLEPGSGPAHARKGSGSEVRDDGEAGSKCGGLRGCGGASRQPACEHSKRCAVITPAGAVAVFRFSTGIIKGHRCLKLIPALRACVSNMLRLMQVLPL